MWWCDRAGTGRAARRVGLGCAAALALSGCESTGIHPLYASHGGALQAELQSIVVDPVPDRLGHYLGDKLQTGLNGTGAHVAPKYHLIVLPRIRVQTPLIDTVTSRAQAASVITDVDYRLVPIGGGEPVAKGTVTSAASYDRSEQRYADLRAARDAEIRDADTVADQIVQQIAAQLAVR